MKQRCKNLSDPNYGGRGITYDAAWEDFDVFLKDMGSCPEGKSLDRINPATLYWKFNCRWASPEKQANNKRNTKMLHFDFDHRGPQGSAAEWARWLREKTGNKNWTVQRLHNCLKVMSMEQIICAISPQRLTPAELKERQLMANRKPVLGVEEYFNRLIPDSY